MCCNCNKDDSGIKKVKQIIRGIIGSILFIYVCLIILVNIPYIQRAIGSWIADSMSKQIGTEVSIGKVDVGLFNRLILDDIYIEDQKGKQLLKSDRTSVRINLLSLLRGKINISNAQLFGLTANLRKVNPNAIPNYQFLINAYSSKKKKESSPIDLRINSFIMRRGHISYDVESEKRKQTLDTNHLNINNIDATISLKVFTEDSLDLTIKRLNFYEENSRLKLKNLQARVVGNDQQSIITDFTLKTHQSSINIDSLTVKYKDYKTDKSYSYKTKISDSYVSLADFNALVPDIGEFTSPLYLDAGINGTQDYINLNGINIHTDDYSFIVNLDGYIGNLRNEAKNIRAKIRQVLLNNEGKTLLFKAFTSKKTLPQAIENLGTIKYSGNFSKKEKNIAAEGFLVTDVGNLSLNINFINEQNIEGFVKSERINLGKIINDKNLGNITFKFNMNGYLAENKLPEGTLNGTVNLLEYKGHKYNNITLDTSRQKDIINVKMNMNDVLACLSIDGSYNEQNSQIEGAINIEKLNPHAIGLIDDHTGEVYSMNLNANLIGKNINSLLGTIDISSLKIATETKQQYNLDNLSLNIEQTEGVRQIKLHSDFADAKLRGNIQIDGIIDAFKNQLAYHLPSLLSYKKANNNQFDFDITVYESDFLKHFIETDYMFDKPIHINGYIDALKDTLLIDINAPRVTNGDKIYANTQLKCSSSKHQISISALTKQTSGNSNIQYLLTANANEDKLQTLLSWNNKQSNKSNGMLYATTEFSDSLGKVKTDINVHKSQIVMNDTLWQIEPSNISLYNKRIICNNIKVHNEEQSILVNGAISDNISDSLVADLNNIEIAYITDLVDFNAVRFKGQVSGRTIISNIYKDIHLNANVTVNNLYIQEGRLGTGYIQAFWDNGIKGIRVNGHIMDFYKDLNRTTDVSGFIAPSKKDIDLKIMAHNTNAEFLNGFLGSTFKNISGTTNGVIHVIGPLNDINIVGDINTDADMRLRATNVMYHTNPLDTIHLRPYQFKFENVRLTDKRENVAVVNGTLTHKNMKNFKYDFNIDMKNFTIYDEHEFNSDKFYATVYADATLELHGSDGHPLRMTADVTPTKGSVFAYDTATPDAISSSNFVEFRDITKRSKTENKKYLLFNSEDNLEEEDKDNKKNESEDDKYQYEGDIFMDISLHINPDCEIKLRMDNSEDGYISTYGTGNLLAHYHNKSPFSLNGIYQIIGGRYRLYLQDIIFRDLELQNGSNVVFNGNPFDANIHLICHHIINSVPLRDLTSNNAYNQNNKVKVICVLDITGKLGNMNFGFDIQLPNVNDETQQLVKSLISTEDEMNMQMIYLLGLGRFYTNEYARANGEYGSNQVNTLLSSTISGQINQMLSNVIGENSKWNFGTGLSTGEKGWNDLDVEGILTGRLLNDRLLINGNFGYRDNALTNTSTFIGDFDVRWRLSENGNTFIKAYNQTNDRYFTKATLNTQGIGLTHQRDFDSWKTLFRKKMKEEKEIKNNN